MQVYIRDPEGDGLVSCEVVAVDEKGATLHGDGWELGGYTADFYDGEGNSLSPEELRTALLREKAEAIWNALREGGCLDSLLSSARLLEKLLDALEGVPLLKSIITKIREE